MNRFLGGPQSSRPPDGKLGRLWRYLSIRKRWLSLILVALLGQWQHYGYAYRGMLGLDLPNIATNIGVVGGPQIKKEFLPPAALITPTPAATPTPVVPVLNPGTFWYDSPNVSGNTPKSM